MYKTIFSNLNEKLKNSRIHHDIMMKDYTTMHIGGVPAAMITIDDERDIPTVYNFTEKNGYIPVFTGRGSNIIFGDNIEKYVVMNFGLNFTSFIKKEDSLFCRAGSSLQRIVRGAAELGITGFEWAIGIPGTVGGAVVNNSGSKKFSICENIIDVKCIDFNGKTVVFTKEKLHPEYRSTIIKNDKNTIVVDLRFSLKYRDRIEILNDLNSYFAEKQNNQPLNEFSAGCIFKNPEGYSAGKLIDECGLKGFKSGGVMISEKHANFIVNFNNASFEDFRRLTNIIIEKVLEKFKIELSLEVEIIGGKL